MSSSSSNPVKPSALTGDQEYIDFILRDSRALRKQLEERLSTPGPGCRPFLTLTSPHFERLAKLEVQRMFVAANILGGPPRAPFTDAEFEEELVKRGLPPNPIQVIRRLQGRCDDIRYRIQEKKEIKEALEDNEIKVLQNYRNVPGPREKFDAVKEQIGVIDEDIAMFEGHYATKYKEMEKISADVRNKCLIPMLEEEMARIVKRHAALGKFKEDLEAITKDPTDFIDKITQLRMKEIYIQKSPWYDGRDEEYFS